MRFVKKNLKWLSIGVIFLLCIFFVLFKAYLNGQAGEEKEIVVEGDEEEVLENILEIEEEIEQKEMFFVDIKGAVMSPGVYEIEEGKKVIDVVHLAGGFAENANTTLINLARQVKNEMVIIIYTNEEVEAAIQENSLAKVIDKECVCPQITNDACLSQDESSTDNLENTNDSSLSSLINLNTATKEELETLPGIGESKAEAIIEYREKMGLFQSIEEIKEVTGIGESLFQKIKDYITV